MNPAEQPRIFEVIDNIAYTFKIVVVLEILALIQNHVVVFITRLDEGKSETLFGDKNPSRRFDTFH